MAFSEKKIFLNILELYLLEIHVFRLKSCKFEHGLVTKNEFEKWPLITFFQCTCIWICWYIDPKLCLFITTRLSILPSVVYETCTFYLYKKLANSSLIL